MAYVITRQGTALQAVETSGEVRVFTTPTFRIYPSIAYPQSANPAIEIRQGADILQLQVTDITSINGVSNATIGGTLPTLLAALIAIPSGHLSQATNATGTTYNALTSQAASQATVVNATGTAIDVQRGGAGAAVSIASGQSYTFVGITNTSQLGVRRTDTSNTPVTVGVVWQA